MASQFIELIIFAGIAFFIINKLIATLGATSEEDKSKRHSVFGDSTSLKDVTNTTGSSPKQSVEKTEIYDAALTQEILEEFAELGNKEGIKRSYDLLLLRLPNFKLIKFLNSAKVVFKMIIELHNSDPEKLSTLVDKRYLEQFKALASRYNVPVNDSNLTVKLSDIYMFGNNVFIRVLFMGQNVISNITDLKEEWTFTKSLVKPGPEWYLSNVE